MNSSHQFTLEGGYIIIVEDSKVEALAISRFLEINKFKVAVFENATDAYNAARQEIPTLIISDVMLPGINGYEFCAMVKADELLHDIPVILLTSSRNPLDLINSLQSGPENFITKPYEQQYLLARIYYLLAHRSQANLQALNRELLQKNDELEAFAHTVSHDLRNPLHAIKGFTEVLDADYGYLLPEEAQQYLQMVLSASNSMGKLIDDLLHFSKSGSASIDKKDTNFSEIVSQILDTFQQTDAERNVKIRIVPDVIVNADPNLMQLVFSNLLGNAWKYTSKCERTEITFGVTDADGKSVYYIQDNGTGFNDAKAEMIFRPFERLHTSDEYPGSGIGLSSVKRIIERHGGKVWAESQPGKGATFYFTLAD